VKQYKLIGANGKQYLSDEPGALGGYDGPNKKLYGRLDCKSALGFIRRGHYVQYRVFFKDEATAKAAGFRPCGKCMKAEYRARKAAGGRD